MPVFANAQLEDFEMFFSSFVDKIWKTTGLSREIKNLLFRGGVKGVKATVKFSSSVLQMNYQRSTDECPLAQKH